MTEEEKPTPREFDWATKVYSKMLECAKATDMSEDTELGDAVMVYTGHLTKLFAELEVPNPYYTKIMKSLRQMGCVEQLRRGGGAAMSEWILLHEPHEEAFRDRRELKTANNSKIGQLEQRVRDQQSVISNLVDRIEKLELVAGIGKGVAA